MSDLDKVHTVMKTASSLQLWDEMFCRYQLGLFGPEYRIVLVFLCLIFLVWLIDYMEGER